MKTNKLFIAAAFALAVLSGCSQKLPYDLENTTHSVVINIRKLVGSSTTLSTDMNDGDYKIVLSIPEQQGDYSMLEEAQIMAVYTYGKTKVKQYAKVVTGIKSFPYTATIDIKDVCKKLNVGKIVIGDRIEFTPCVKLKSGEQIDGWSPLTGFNNTLFTGWQQPDGPYTYRVAYTAFAPFHKEKFQGDAVAWEAVGGSFYTAPASGTCKVTQVTTLPESMPAGVTAADLVGLKVEGDFLFGNDNDGFGGFNDVINMWINTQDFTIILPDQQIAPDCVYPGVGTHPGEADNGEGEVDTLNNALTFYLRTLWGPYTFGDAEIKLQF